MRALINRLFYNPLPLTYRVLKKINFIVKKSSWKKLPVPPDMWPYLTQRLQYFYCIHRATEEALKLNKKEISIIEFGVAQGNGLIEIENICSCINKINNQISFKVYGFDLQTGLPQPKDYRDLPYLWNKGFYNMDIDKLKNKLQFSELLIGDVGETTKTFFETYSPPPIGAIFFDLDYYSSTKKSFRIFSGDDKYYLPRVYCYFDDVFAIEFIGEKLAIKEFNEKNEHKKIGKSFISASISCPIDTALKMYEFHNFSHPEYSICLNK